MDVKKTAIVLTGAFAGFFVFSAPTDAAFMLKQTGRLAWNLLSGAAHSLQTFVTTLIR